MGRLKLSNLEVFALASLRLSNDPVANTYISRTQWHLSIALQGSTSPHNIAVDLRMSWPAATTEQTLPLAKGFDAPGHYEKPFPTFAIHQQIADFIESHVHENLDLLAFQAARLFFQISEEVIGRSPYISLNYTFNAQWCRSLFRQVQESFQIERASSHVFIALGSNIGDRIGMIEQACVEMAHRGLRVRHTSSLYETEAMYKTDQPSFVNGVCEIETDLPPMELLDQLKDIEKSLGRVKTVENGPRNIDLDILLYDNRIVNEERLQIPHPRISEREFVLRPLCDLIPDSFLPQPNILLDFSIQLSFLPRSSTPISPLTPLARFTPSSPTPQHSQFLTPSLPTRKTHIMAILNLTPDSFSHDGKHTHNFTPSSLLPQLHSLLHNQISILDIGGQSTRPHATPLSAEEELARVLPTVKFIRSDPAFKSILLSIDTYHSSVVRACVEAGADIINDVSGGLMDKNMFATVAELGCTYVLMHMRGTPETMNTLTSYPDGVIQGVATELEERVKKAMEAGVRRWRIILDPGIGFAKTADQNLEVLRKLPVLREWKGLQGLPWCVGVSRKGFIGKISEVGGGWVHPRERGGMDHSDHRPKYIATESSERDKRAQDEVKREGLGNWGKSLNREQQHAATSQTSLSYTPTPSSNPNRLEEEAKSNAGPNVKTDHGSEILGNWGMSLNREQDTTTTTTTTTTSETSPSYTPTPSSKPNRLEEEAKSNADPNVENDHTSEALGNWGMNSNHKQQQHTTTPPTSQSAHTPPNPTHLEGEAKGDAGPGVKTDQMKDRIWGTAAAVTACVQGGVDVVRVHDWEEMGRVVRIGEAVWRV
ncbi:MAG: hypothetical protein Q9186_004791 [Xanthomendoza sp. 1 TL-2023]